MAECLPYSLPLPVTPQLNSRRVIKICPDCAIKHFTHCENNAADVQEECSNCDALVSGAAGGVCFLQVVLLAFRAVSALTGSLMRLLLALLLAAEFIVKLALYAVDSFKWVRQERNTPKAVVKGAACGTAALILCYIAWMLIFVIILPSLTFIYKIFENGYSLI